MKYSEVEELSTEDLAARLQAEKTALNKLKFAHAATPLENPNVIRTARKDIARMATELTKRKNAATLGKTAAGA